MLAGSPSIAERGSFIKINQSNSAKKRYLKAFFSPIYSSRYEPSSQMMSASRESSDSLKITVMTPLDSEYPEPLHSVWKSAKNVSLLNIFPNCAHICFDNELICQIELTFVLIFFGTKCCEMRLFMEFSTSVNSSDYN